MLEAARRPPGPRGLGSLRYQALFALDADRALAALHARYGRVVRLRLGPLPVTLVVGPEANRLLMTSSPSRVQARPIWTRILPFYRGAVLATDGARHAQLRRLLQDVSSLERIRDYVPVMDRIARERIAGWGARIDLYAELEHIALAITTQTLMGTSLSDAEQRRFFGWHRAISGMILGIPGNELPLSRRWRGARAQRAMWDLLERIVQERRGCPGRDALSRLVAATERGPDGAPPISEREVIVHAFTLFAAGHATMAALLYFSLVTALARPELLRRLEREHAQLLGDGPPTLERLRGLTHTLNLLREVERVYPPLPYIARTAVCDLDVLGYRLPAGSTLMGGLRLGHLLEDCFAAPRRFDPDRFAPPREEHRRHPYALAAFGGGPHICLGMSFALTEACVVLHAILDRVRLRLEDHDGALPRVRFRPFAVPRERLVATVVSRDS